ncbi:MAG: response regulator [Deltaproteobacteria bacterium]|nr:response regulator [Deltaproteobacteria bacterium]
MGKPFKLLIIDDNEEFIAALSAFFSNKEFDVVYASDGLDGLKLFEAEKDEFDLVITDIVMPNISGVGVISIIRKHKPDIPVIAITGWGEHPEVLALEAQANLVLEKPFNLNDLYNSIKDILSP